MPRKIPTHIRIDERGNEAHESWLLIRANHVSSSSGARLFDSEIAHPRYVQVTISRCTRKRELHRDWLYSTTTLLEMDMSEAQWGAFVSSFGNGTGVPATLSWFNGEQIPGVADLDSRLRQSHEDVRSAASRAVEDVRVAEKAVQDAFDRGAGKKEMRDLLRHLQIVTANLPANMEFAAQSLTEHVENVVTKARGDIESMVVAAAHSGIALEASHLPVLEIEATTSTTSYAAPDQED